MKYAKLHFSVTGHLRLHLGSKSIFLNIGSNSFEDMIKKLTEIMPDFKMSEENHSYLIDKNEAINLGFYKEEKDIDKSCFIYDENSIADEIVEEDEDAVIIEGNGQEVSFEGLTAKGIVELVLKKTDKLITLSLSSKKPIIRKATKLLTEHGYKVVEKIEQPIEEESKEKVIEVTEEFIEEENEQTKKIEVNEESKESNIEINEVVNEEQIINSNGKVTFEGLTARKIVELVYDKTGEQITLGLANKKPIITNCKILISY